jgi:hypothetical protein
MTDDIMKGLLVISIVIASFLFVAGCTDIPFLPGPTTGGGTETKQGVVIDKFEPVITKVGSSEPVAFRVKLKNTGTETAFDVSAKLTNIDEFMVYNQPTKYFDELPSDTTGTGNYPEVTWSWDLDAPLVPKGTEVIFHPRIRVLYTYKTETVRSVTIIPEVELRDYINKGKAFPSDTVSKSSGPLSLDISIKGPIAHYQDKIQFPVSMTIKNIGGGIVCREECTDSERDYNTVDLYLETNDVKLKDCELNGIRLSGDTATVVCNAEIIDTVFFGLLKIDTTQTTKKNIRFNIVYTYIIDDVGTLTVVGK